jgi:hypothetical protein
MSKYPAAAGQGLYDSSTTQVHNLGTEMTFSDSNNDPVFARYMQWAGGATIAAGKVVGIDYDAGIGKIDTVIATAAIPQTIMGGLAASCDSTGYAWVIFRGRQTNASMAASYASLASARWLLPNGSAALASEASGAAPALSSASLDRLQICAYQEDGTSNTTGANGNVIWIWR